MAKKPTIKAAPVSLLTIPDQFMPYYKRIVTMIKANREINPTEYGLIALLAQNYYFNQMASQSMIVDGLSIYSASKYGNVPKNNPAVQVQQKTSDTITRLSEKLVLTQKEQYALYEPEVEEEEDDVSQREKERQERLSKQ